MSGVCRPGVSKLVGIALGQLDFRGSSDSHRASFSRWIRFMGDLYCLKLCTVETSSHSIVICPTLQYGTSLYDRGCLVGADLLFAD